jgi:hypothetical protein
VEFSRDVVIKVTGDGQAVPKLKGELEALDIIRGIHYGGDDLPRCDSIADVPDGDRGDQHGLDSIKDERTR